MTSDFISIGKDSFAKFLSGTYILPRLPDGRQDDGHTFKLPGKIPDTESLAKSTSSKAVCEWTLSYTNLTTLEQNGCGQMERRLQEEMKKSTQRFLMKLQEDLFVNSGKKNQGLSYEQKQTSFATKEDPGRHSPFNVRAC